MPKMKSHSGAKKRFKITAKGKVKFKKSNMSHILSHESRNHKRHLRGTGVLQPQDARHVIAMLPYG